MLNTIILGDCLNVMSNIPSNSVNMVLCDLPYGVTKNKWDCPIDLPSLWKQWRRICTPTAPIILTGVQPFSSILVNSNLTDFRYSWVWEKTNASGHLNARKMPLRAHEDILVFYRKPCVYNPQKTTGHTRKVSTAAHRKNTKLSSNYGSYVPNTYDSTERFPRSVIKFKMDKQLSALHPTQKPVALFEYLIKTYSNAGDTILDNCIGSGTTAVAAMNTGRNFIGIEKDQQCYNDAVQRIKNS